MQQLKVGSSLQGGKYKIEKVLGQGGFGITYLATQELLDRKVCIKEFFFKDYCNRSVEGYVSSSTLGNEKIVERFLVKFLKEARTISRLEHPNIIRILDIYQENGTAYYVMEYIEGSSLADRISKYGTLQEFEAVNYVKQVASALEYIHQHNINHLDVKPANIMIRKSDNKAILIDFGVSKQYDEQGGQTSTTPVGISHGYAPMEQYTADGVKTFSPQTDIYSLGATLYNLLTATQPPVPYQILDGGINLPNHISKSLADAIRQAMQPNRSKRPANIAAFVSLLQINNRSVKDYVKEQTTFVNEETQVYTTERKRIESASELRRRADNIKKEFVKTTNVWMYIWLAISFIPLFLSFMFVSDGPFGENKTMLSLLCGFSFFSIIVGGIYMIFGIRHYIKKKSLEWKDQHPDDPVCKYIKTDNFWNIENN